jgi:hypothetical protein
MHPAREFQITARKRFVEHHVRGKRGAAVDAFEQVVAGERVLRHTPLEASLKGVDVVDALADVDSGAEEILVDVGDRTAVDVDRGVSREEPSEARAIPADGIDLDAWLDDRVAGHDSARLRIELGAVQRMSEDPHQSLERAARQRRIRVERHHEAHAPKTSVLPCVCRERGRRVAPQQAIELFELASLALPAHPTGLGCVVLPRTVQRVKRARILVAVAPVQAGDPRHQRLEHGVIVGQSLRAGVGKVAEKDELDRGLRVAEVVALELLEQSVDLSRAPGQAGHDDRGLVVQRNSRLEVELGEHPRRQHLGQAPVHQRDAERRRRERRHQQCDCPHLRRGPLSREMGRGQDQRDTGRSSERQRIEPGSMAGQRAAKSNPGGRAIGQGGLELPLARTLEPVADVRAQRIASRESLRVGDDAIRDLRLRMGRGPRQPFDEAAVAIGGLEVHARIDSRGVGPQDRFDPTRLLEEVLPRDRRDDPKVAQGVGDALRLLEGRVR